MNPIDKPQQRSVRVGSAAAAVFVAVAVAVLATPVRAASEAAVGQVSLLIGQAKVVRRDGTTEALQRGSAIHVGDRVETSVNGHVHVRFIDNGAISVRPDSVLEVRAYRYDADSPHTSEVRFQLDHGTSRSISGRATEVDKNRFRLNTPIAAIGVRGTDFIVNATDLGVKATVAEGAIVVGALGAGCSAAALGPCVGGQTSVLSADMGRFMIELARGEQVARVVPAIGPLLAGAAPGGEERVVAQRAAEANARNAGLMAAEPFRHNDRSAAELITVAEANAPELNRPSDPAAKLAWGRYTLLPVDGDQITRPFMQSRAGRHVTVGSSEYTLFRADDPANPERQLPLGDAKVDFRISRAHATFEVGGRTEVATVEGGTLTLDFGRRTFGTALALSSDSAGRAELRLAGDVRSDGTFAVRDADQKQFVAGAVSLDRKEAGYLFERGVGGGLFKGRTLWGR